MRAAAAVVVVEKMASAAVKTAKVVAVAAPVVDVTKDVAQGPQVPAASAVPARQGMRLARPATQQAAVAHAVPVLQVGGRPAVAVAVAVVGLGREPALPVVLHAPEAMARVGRRGVLRAHQLRLQQASLIDQRPQKQQPNLQRPSLK
jgi:hypothetical protein